MKTIIKGKDDLYYVINITGEDGNPLTVSDIDAIKIDFYTPDSQAVTFTQDDISPEGVLHVDSSCLADMKDGALKAKIYISLTDEGFQDGTYDTVHERLTGYFLKSERNLTNHEEV